MGIRSKKGTLKKDIDIFKHIIYTKHHVKGIQFQ